MPSRITARCTAVIQFYKEALKAGIKPIIGCEVYVAARSRFDMEHNTDSGRNHLILLCKDETGYKNLCLLVSKAYTEGFYIKPRVDMELFAEIQRRPHRPVGLPRRRNPAASDAGRLRRRQGEGAGVSGDIRADSFYLELQNHGLREQQAVNDGLVRLAGETGIPLVVTNDVHYIAKKDAAAQDILMCIQTGKTVADTDRLRFETEEFYLKSEDEMRALFPQQGEAFDNTQRIAEMCNLTFEFNKYHLPEFMTPAGYTAAEYLKKLCLEGFARRYEPTREDVKKQLFYELDMIERMGFTDYFLITSDFIAYAKSQGIPVGPGRGSAAGSVASYCLDITTVDPIKYGLYFERFLNPERVSMPDIDIDFCERRRGEVIDYVKRKYGEDRVAQIVTFNTLKAKNAVRNVAKAVGLTFAEENELAREVPSAPGAFNIKLADALASSKRLREMYEGDERIKKVIDTAMALEDMPKDSGTHAAGVVITKKPRLRVCAPHALQKGRFHRHPVHHDDAGGAGPFEDGFSGAPEPHGHPRRRDGDPQTGTELFSRHDPRG